MALNIDREQAVQVGLRVVTNAAIAAGIGAAYVKVREKLMEYKGVADVASTFKEWTDALVGGAIIALYEIFRNRLPPNRLIDQAVVGLTVYAMARSFAVLFGEPFVLVTKDGKAYIKNIPQISSGWEAYIDGTKATVTADGTIKPTSNVAEGVHDFAVIGAGKAAYSHQYMPAIKV